ncbi:MAG: hypothetical protein PHG82_04680 [Candidatus Gracilibacteria bacterium]|nr:hypothetical protein [Candidatus Gracilibacteria bacterium]
MFIVKLIYAILLITGGYSIVRYRRNVHEWTGNFVWAEQYLGSGGTYIVITFAGLALIFFGTLYPFGGIAIIIGN